MPYIKQQDREKFEEVLNHFDKNAPYDDYTDTPFVKIESCGELNYLFSMLSKFYIEQNGENYQRYNDIVGALEGAKLELYRRQISKYEDKKISENGDVF